MLRRPVTQGWSAPAQTAAPGVRAGRRPRRLAIVEEDRPVSSPYALKREKAAWRESVAAVESAILRVGANLDPQPVAGTVGARAPLRYDRQPRVRAWPGPHHRPGAAPAAAPPGAMTREYPSIPASRARISANVSSPAPRRPDARRKSSPGLRFRGPECRGRYPGSCRPPNPGESPGPRWPDPLRPPLPPAIR